MKLLFIYLLFFSFNSKAFDVEKLGDVLEQGVKQLEKELNKQQNNQPPNNINKPVQQNEQSQDTQNNIDEEKRKLQEERKALEAEKKKLEAQKKADEEKRKLQEERKALEAERKKFEAQKKADEEKKNNEKQKSADEKRKKIEAQKKAEADKKLEEQGNVAKKRKKLGINVQDVTPEIANFLGLKNEDGVVISAVNPGEPAEKGGLKSRDVILELNGKKIKDVKSMLKAMTDSSIKNKADVKVWRDKKIKTFTVNLGEDTQKKYMERGKVEEKNKLKSTEQNTNSDKTETSDKKEIIINLTGYKDSKSLIDKTSQCNLTLDITNNSYGTIYRLDVDVDVIDDRGEKIKVVGFNSKIGNSTFTDRKPIPLGKTVSFKSDMTLQTQCKFIRNFKFTKVKPKFCNIRMLPEKVDCLNLIKAKVSF